MIISGDSLASIISDQYHLSSKANISILESNLMPDFEKEAFLNLILKEAEKMLEK